MKPETYEAIKKEWCKRSNAEQRNLIYRYIQGDSKGLRGSWMEFLQIQFGLHRSASELQKDPSVRIRSACQA
ncbi:MAG: hypothetical protein V2I36_05955 [Desulfopila sp.]|nr:hypothetical protein [Desulfopila sp.]